MTVELRIPQTGWIVPLLWHPDQTALLGPVFVERKGYNSEQATRQPLDLSFTGPVTVQFPDISGPADGLAIYNEDGQFLLWTRTDPISADDTVLLHMDVVFNSN